MSRTIFEKFETKDHCLAAAVIASGKKNYELRWQGTIAFFVFSDDPQICLNLARAYKTNELNVRALDYALAIKEIKFRLYSQKYNK